MSQGQLSVLSSLWIRCMTQLPPKRRIPFHSSCLSSGLVYTFRQCPSVPYTQCETAQFHALRNTWLLAAVVLDTASKPSFFRKMAIWWAQICALKPLIRAAGQICTWLLSEWNWLFKYFQLVTGCLCLLVYRLHGRYHEMAPNVVPMDYTKDPDVKLPMQLIINMPELKVSLLTVCKLP